MSNSINIQGKTPSGIDLLFISVTLISYLNISIMIGTIHAAYAKDRKRQDNEEALKAREHGLHEGDIATLQDSHLKTYKLNR